jgi:hypothetical protein
LGSEPEGVAIMGAPWAVGEGGTLENGLVEGVDVGVDGGVECCEVEVKLIGADPEMRGAEELKGDRVGLSDGLLSSPLFFFGLAIK